MAEVRKRETAYKLKIGDILAGTPIVEDVAQEAAPNPTETQSQIVREKFRFLELGEKKIVRVNLISNVVDKYISDGEKKFATVTIDDATGQIRLKVFGEDTVIFNDISQGDTILAVGVLRSYNGEIYLLPEIVRKIDPRYLLIRKLELEKKSSNVKKTLINEPAKQLSVRDEIIEIIKSGEQTGGIGTDEIILKVKSVSPEIVNSEIIKLIEDGTVYEPRPGKVRYLG
jgi:RPA family protein